MRRIVSGLFCLVSLCTVAGSAFAQNIPRITGVFPAGARAGETIEVTVRGGNMLGAKKLLFSSPGGVTDSGITGEVVGGAVTVDASAKPLHAQKCANCHELRSPSNRSYSPEQWAEIVTRMIKQRSAPINAEEETKITGYLQAMARAGEVKFKVAVPKETAPGRRELRVLTDNGVTTATTFEVGSATMPEVLSEGEKTSKEKPQKLTLPVIVNGGMWRDGLTGDFLSFDAKKGERITFNLKGYRLREMTQEFFNPALYLYDPSGALLTKSMGGSALTGLDPVLDWSAPADGTYTLLVRDLLYHGNPTSVYRLAIGPALPYDAQFAPAALVRPGETMTARVNASVPLAPEQASATVKLPQTCMDGVMTVSTLVGDVPLVVRDLPDGGAPLYGDLSKASAVALPAAFRGAITTPKAKNVYKVKTTRPNVPIYFTSAGIGSPLRGWVIITRPTGEYVNGYYADHPTDYRFDNALPQPGEYLVTVQDGNEQGGMNYGYVLEAWDNAPEFSLTATPDAINLVPGGTAAVTVRVNRRENIAGAITINFRDLPAGVAMLPAVIPPDDDKTTVVLQAAPGTGVSANPVIIEGIYTDAAGKTTTRRAAPIELFRFNNNSYRPFTRDTQTVAVAASDPTPPISIAIEGMENGIELPFDREKEIKVKLTRRADYKNDLFIVPLNFPPGISLRGNTYVGGDKSELSLSLYADGNARFLKGERPTPNLPPMTIVFAVRQNGTGDMDYIACTPSIILKGKPPEPPKK